MGNFKVRPNHTLQLKRFCFQKLDLDFQMKELKSCFSRRGYPEKVIREQVNRTLRSEENVKGKDGQHMQGNGGTISCYLES